MKYLVSVLLAMLTFSLHAQDIALVQYANGFDRPTDIAHAGDGRLFIVEQQGVVLVLDENGDRLSTPFLDIENKVNFGENEQGMLGLAFDPDFANNGFFYVSYVTGNGSGISRVSRYSVSADPNVADADSETIILEVDQPQWNHNGGDINFGPDGYMYLGFGDGGSGGDPWGNAQNAQTLLGKMLRIDVNGAASYTVPADNPFVNDSDVLDEIWALGLRNPWRFSFDALTGDLWIGDVGQRNREEIDFQAAASPGGENYGWDCREGELSFNAPSNLCTPTLNLTEPVATYKASNFCNSVTGGYVYRGCRWPDLYGRYLYADYCNGLMWSILPDGQGGWTNEEVFNDPVIDISTFGVDQEGELYVARHGSGIIYQVTMGEELTSPEVDLDGEVVFVPAGLGAYQWFRNGEAIPGADSSAYRVVEDSGDYSVEITYSNGCTTLSEPLTVFILSTNNTLSFHQFTVHPNPFEGQLNLALELEQVGNLQLEILNMSGQKVWSENVGTTLQYSQTYDLQLLPKGVYFLRLITEQGEVSRKIVRQ
ncbi:MAG: PQQ-dependent sugar dehydrogenase [Bacteroidota bacterium]